MSEPVPAAVQRDFDAALTRRHLEYVRYMLARAPRLLSKYMVPFSEFIDASNLGEMIGVIRFMFKHLPAYTRYVRSTYSAYFETRGTDTGTSSEEMPPELIAHIRQLVAPDDADSPPPREKKQGENDDDDDAVTPEEMADFLADIDMDMTGGYAAHPGFTGLSRK